MSSSAAYDTHPCFGMTARREVGRLHLPVAPRANARIRFAPTPKASPAMTPEDAVEWLGRVKQGGHAISVVGITGPGDPLAVPAPTLRTLEMVREAYPDISLCLTTLGIGGAEYAQALADLDLSHVTVLVDAVEPEVAEKLYAWIRPSTKTVPLPQASRDLMNEQAKTVAALKKAGVTVKINTTVYPGYNAGHVEEIASAMASLGADIMAVVPYRPTAGVEDGPAAAGTELMSAVIDRVSRHMELMPSWEECGEGLVGITRPDKADPVSTIPRPTKERPNVAVVSSTGMDVDLHLGHARQILVYGPREDGLACLLETRKVPAPGTGASRWKELGDTLSDCFVLLAASAGERPRQVLREGGMPVLITDGSMSSAVDALYGGGKKKGKGCNRAV